jgi:hypothetical protein
LCFFFIKVRGGVCLPAVAPVCWCPGRLSVRLESHRRWVDIEELLKSRCGCWFPVPRVRLISASVRRRAAPLSATCGHAFGGGVGWDGPVFPESGTRDVCGESLLDVLLLFCF